MKSASEMNDITKESIAVNPSMMLEQLRYRIEDEANNGNFELHFHTGGEHFSADELKYIRDLGYEIFWNSPCLWYEVSWK